MLAVLKSSNDFKDCIKYGFVNFTPALSMLKTPKAVLNHILDMDSHLVDSTIFGTIPFIIYRCDTKLCELFAKVQIVMSSWSLIDMVLDLAPMLSRSPGEPARLHRQPLVYYHISKSPQHK